MEQLEKYEIWRLRISSIFITIMFLFHPFFFLNKYFDISEAKWKFFVILSFIYVFFIIVTYIFDEKFLIYFKKLIAGFTVTEYAFLAFLAFTIISTIASSSPFASFTGGYNARYHGCLNIILYAFFFFIIRRHFKNDDFLMIVFCYAGAFVNLISICQYFDWDFLGMYNGVTVASKRRMISTIGNMNTYASYLCMVASATIFLYVYSKKTVSRIFWGIGISLCFAGGLAGNSDSFYLGTGAAMIIFICAGGLTLERFSYLFSALCWAAGGALIFLIAGNSALAKGSDIRPAAGIAIYLSRNISLIAIILAASLCIFIFLRLLIFLKKSDSFASWKLPKPGYRILVGTFIAFFAGVILYVIMLYPFEDTLGSYRGFIWNLSISDFKQMPLVGKLIGYGPETIYSVFYEKYYKQMVTTTGVLYDNVHSEPLEYLMTSGILGAASYLTLVISLLVRLFKKARQDERTYMFLLPIFAYFVQSFVNIAQSATTPLYFLIIALAGGFLQGEEQK